MGNFGKTLEFQFLNWASEIFFCLAILIHLKAQINVIKNIYPEMLSHLQCFFRFYRYCGASFQAYLKLLARWNPPNDMAIFGYYVRPLASVTMLLPTELRNQKRNCINLFILINIVSKSILLIGTVFFEYFLANLRHHISIVKKARPISASDIFSTNFDLSPLIF